MPLELKDITYKYSPNTSYEVTALSHINLTLSDGEFIGIIGHTGSGKSTLVQHLNGLLRATEGEIIYNGENIYDKKYSMRDLRTQVGMVFQYPEPQLFEATVYDDVAFGPKNQGLPEKDVGIRTYDALRAVGVPDDICDSSPFDLSGGQKRRVAIAGVLAMKPAVLILDEPTAGLDPKGREEILHLIKDMHERSGNTVILVSHSMEDVADYVDRIIVMDKGSVRYDDTPKNVFKHHRELEEMGLAVPQVTYFMNDMKENGFDVSTDPTTVEEACDEIMNYFRKMGRVS